MIGHVHGCGWLYIPRIKNNKIKNKRLLWVSPRLSKRKINAQVCSVIRVLSTLRRDQPAGSETCNTTETFYIYRPATGLGRISENTINLQKYFIDVADLS